MNCVGIDYAKMYKLKYNLTISKPLSFVNLIALIYEIVLILKR